MLGILRWLTRYVREGILKGLIGGTASIAIMLPI